MVIVIGSKYGPLVWALTSSFLVLEVESMVPYSDMVYCG